MLVIKQIGVMAEPGHTSKNVSSLGLMGQCLNAFSILLNLNLYGATEDSDN